MTGINSHYLELGGGYLFAAMRQRVEEYQSRHPEADIIRLGIGDVTRPLTPAVIAALRRATDEMADPGSFRGYGPEAGYDFLRDAIALHEYRRRGIEVAADEIFVSDGGKCDAGNLQEIFAAGCTVGIADPVYPVYRDSNIMAGRAITYLPATEENGFVPRPPETGPAPELIYLCSPNNPTGAAMSRRQLAEWVDYALGHGSVIVFDAAYAAYIRDPELPRSIYEIPGARRCAVECRSFSKTAGFTGLRCAFTVVPGEIEGVAADGRRVPLRELWNRRQATKFNGVAYIVQRAAEAVYSEAGRRETAGLIDYYMANAAVIARGLTGAGFEVFGGENAPYLWWKLPAGLESADFMSTLLNECQVVGTPGAGFGRAGEGYFRLTAFGDRERTEEAVGRIAAGKVRLWKSNWSGK